MAMKKVMEVCAPAAPKAMQKTMNAPITKALALYEPDGVELALERVGAHRFYDFQCADWKNCGFWMRTKSDPRNLNSASVTCAVCGGFHVADPEGTPNFNAMQLRMFVVYSHPHVSEPYSDPGSDFATDPLCVTCQSCDFEFHTMRTRLATAEALMCPKCYSNLLVTPCAMFSRRGEMIDARSLADLHMYDTS